MTAPAVAAPGSVVEGAEAPRLKLHERYHVTRAILHERFPGAFCGRSDKPVPLKIGIHDDLIAVDDLGICPGWLRVFLQMWTRRYEYRGVLVEGAVRIGLNGEPTGTVSADHAGHARGELKARDKARTERKAAHKAAIQRAAAVKALPSLTILDNGIA